MRRSECWRILPLLGPIVAVGLLRALPVAAAPAAGGGADRPPGWPLPPQRLEALLATAPFQVARVDSRIGGVSGAVRLDVRFPGSGEQFPVKWKATPRGRADGWNNSPRKEIAAYEVQKLFLDPPDYVVPTSALRCIPLRDYWAIRPRPVPTFEGVPCVLGLVSAWVSEVRADPLRLDPERFEKDPAYARELAHLNLLTYLVAHRDGRSGNFLESRLGPRVYAVDNGISFGTLVYNFLVPNWDVLRVPALPRAAVDRLRGVGPEDLRALGVLAELHVDRLAGLGPAPPGPNLDPAHGVRRTPGVLQIGLTRHEIEGLRGRLEDLLARVDRGEIPLF